VFRQFTSLERSYHRALTELRRLTQERAQAEPEPDTKPETEPQSLPQGEIPLPKPPQTGAIGFVPPIPASSGRPLGTTPDLSLRLPSTPVSATFGRLSTGEPIAVRSPKGSRG
jgi:hypothetical protein